MAAAASLKVTHAVDKRVEGVADTVEAIDNRVVTVDDRVKVVDNKVMEVIAGAYIISSLRNDTLTELLRRKGNKGIRATNCQ